MEHAPFFGSISQQADQYPETIITYGYRMNGSLLFIVSFLNEKRAHTCLEKAENVPDGS
jgi:hypothetical protein